ncbi:MAG: hypothetical protein ACOX0A_04025 [Thermoguttaceae bacterium]|jgi:hypothetical protein
MSEPDSANDLTKSWRVVLGAPILGLVVLVVALFFLNKPFASIVDAEEAVPRWVITLNPFCNENFFHDVWLGVDLPQAPYTAEPLIALGLGVLIIASTFFLGRALFEPFRTTLAPNKCETVFFSGLLGLVALSFLITIAGLFGRANLPILPMTLAILAIGLSVTGVRCAKSQKGRREQDRDPIKPQGSSYSRFYFIAQILILILFATFYVFAATQPLFEYDALEYHAQGAREIFETGAIKFSHNNVYVNMPLGAEMFYVAGMNAARDVGYSGVDVLRIGLLAGKTILVGVTLLTTMGLVCFGFRFFRSVRCGLWAAIAFLSFPNLFGVCSNGLNEGVLALTLLSATYILLLKLRKDHSGLCADLNAATLLGIVAGFAAAVKYTGVVFICIPVFLALAFLPLLQMFQRRGSSSAQNDLPNLSQMSVRRPLGVNIARTGLTLCAFVLGVIVVCGGWYIKNYRATGNPVYPLAYSIFGDSTNEWNDSINERWKKAHSASGFGAPAIQEAIAKTFWRDDFSSPLYLFVPLVGILGFFGVCFGRRWNHNDSTDLKLAGLFLLVAVYWCMWFLLTHRLTRFLIPVAPIAALILGVGIYRAINSRSYALRISVIAVTLFSLLYSGLLIDVLGQGRLAPLRSLEQDPARFSAAALYFNNHPELLIADESDNNVQRKLLLIGDAKACAYHTPVLYSTCWNNSPLMAFLEDAVERNESGKIVGISDPMLISQRLKDAGVAYVSVDFGELSRFQSEGNYGLTNPELDANLFMQLMEANVIDPVVPEELENSPSIQIFKTLGGAENLK